KVRQEKAQRFVELAQGNLKWMPGAREFLAQVREWGWDCGVGTGAHRSESDFIINECGISEYVNVWVSGDEVPKNKPHPDVFLKVAEKLGRNPQECIVMENSSMGLKAASEAGMRCFVVPSRFTLQQDFSGAAKQSSRLDEFKRMDFETEPIL
ncbi:MAG: hydrolase, CbbY/CbbZ/GpH/YieH family, partial [uncultured bacterium]